MGSLSFGIVLTAQTLFKVCPDDCKFIFWHPFNDVCDKQYNGNIKMYLLISKWMKSHFKAVGF